jgi:phospholipid transport system transporter-binding protein
MFETGSDITHDTAKTVLKAGLKHIARGEMQLDCARLSRFDSSVLAVFLAWQRAARAQRGALSVLNVPAALSSLARAYGIDTLVLKDSAGAVAAAESR